MNAPAQHQPIARRRKAPEDRRACLLRAAAHVLLRDGLRALTLDAVSREAAVSKGGLLHHFPSRTALTEALIEDVTARLRDGLVLRAEADPEPSGRRLRAYVETLVTPAIPSEARDAAVLAALLVDAGALRRWRHFSEEWLGPDLTGDDPGQVNVLRMLADGAWLASALGLHPVSASAREPVVRHLCRIACP